MSSLAGKAIRLIINADDFGYCPKRDAAIIALLEQRSISSVSLLVNGYDAERASEYAVNNQVSMGIHLNLTEGRPVTKDLRKVRSLVDDEGLMHGKFGLRHRLEAGLIRLADVEYELDMQLSRYRALTGGQLPRHVDGHQHIHVHPLIVDSVARLAHRYGIEYIRAPHDVSIATFGTDQSFHSEIVTQAMSAVHAFDRYALTYPRCFFGMSIMGEQLTVENVEKCLSILERQPTGGCALAELMCHPGYPSDPLVGGCGTAQPDAFSCSSDRQREFEVLSSRELRALFEKYNVQLCAYGEISYGSRWVISLAKT